MAEKTVLVRGVYTGNDIANYALEAIEGRRAGKGHELQTGIGALDRHMAPVMPGETVIVLAYTSHGKTAFMQHWARQVTRQIQDAGRLAVYVTWETTIEELGIYDLCGLTGIDAATAWRGDLQDVEMDNLRMAGLRRAAMPLWAIGYSMKRRREVKLNMQSVSDSLRAMEDTWKQSPAVIFLDYIQRIDPHDWRDDRRVQILKIIDAIQQLARDFGCAVVAGCQAGRQVLDRPFPLPQIGDGQETSRIEQDADKVLSLYFPAKIKQIGETLPELGNMAVTEDLVVMGIRKQRHAASGQVFPLRFDPARNTFTSWEG